jgi:two-component system sensor histidine kinase KdpD
VVLVDLTAEALQNRLQRGVVYTADKARRAMENFFTETNLTALREMALRHTAHEVEGRLSDLPGPARGRTPVARPGAEPPARHERILICLTGRPSTAVLIRRGKRVADYLHAECLAVHVQRGSPKAHNDALEKHLSFARNLHIDTYVLRGADAARTIVDFAREQNITQIFMGRAGRGRWYGVVKSTVHRVVRLAREREITVVAERLR